MVNTNCVEKPVNAAFEKYGRFVARHPVWFIVIPVLIAGGLGTGILFVKYETDVELLFTPSNGQAKVDRALVMDLLPMNESSEFDPIRLPDEGIFGRLIISANDGGSILRESIITEILNVDQLIKNISVDSDGQSASFKDLCAKWKSTCATTNLFLYLLEGDASRVHNLSLTYPQYELTLPGLPPVTIQGGPMQKTMRVSTASVLGGVVKNRTDHVISAESTQLFYFLDSTNGKMSLSWLKEFQTKMSQLTTGSIDITYYTVSSLEEELDKATTTTITYFTIMFTIMITFSIVACIMFDWVLSKPWLGALGVFSACLAVLSCFGLLMFCGVSFISLVGVTPYLTIAIGVDDMFVILAAWRETDPRETVEIRLGRTFSDAAISITITTVTDVLAFGIGAITYFPSVEIFCLYTNVAVLFDFFFQTTFFMGCMALFGRREDSNRHALTCMRVLPKSESGQKSTFYKYCCAGGNSTNEALKTDETITNTHSIMTFFREYYGPFIMRTSVKVVTIILFLSYIGVSIWGCYQVKEGLDLRSLAADDSYAITFYDQEDKYFKKYGAHVMIVFKTKLDYSSQITTSHVNGIVKKLGDTSFFSDSNSTLVSWIHDYEKYLSVYSIPYDKDNFTDILFNSFLNEPAYTKYKLDIVSDKDNDIVTSRIFMQAVGMCNSTRDRHMMETARSITEASELDVFAYHPAFIYYDQYVIVLQNTLQNVGIATGCMLVVALIFIPNPLVTLWVFLSIVSICTGVIGLMTLWSVDIDSVSMICIIMSIGFCVDFSAHIAYAFSKAKGEDGNQMACFALGVIGLPILQGAASTVFGIVILIVAPAHIFRVFFKVLFIVIVTGFFHGILILPVFMALAAPATNNHVSANETSELPPRVMSNDQNLLTPSMKNWIDNRCRPSLIGQDNAGYDGAGDEVKCNVTVLN